MIPRRVLFGALALCVACGGRKGPEVPTVTVKKTKFARIVDADGFLKAERATAVTMPSGDMMMKLSWLIQDGSEVKAGDVIARIDDLDLRARLAGAEEDRETAEAQKQKEALLNQQGRQDRQRVTLAADRELTMARSFQRTDSMLFSRDQIVESEVDEKLQTAKAQHARSALSVDGQVARRKLQLHEVNAKKADELIARAKKGLEMLEVRAPHDGVVVLKQSYRGEPMRVGDTVYPGQPLAEVALREKLQAEVFVLEIEAAGLAKKKKAQVILESLPDRTFEAEVARVESVAKKRQFRSPTQYFGVTLNLTKTDTAVMKPGQRVRGRLHIDELDALVVPRPALFEKDGKWVAYRQQGAAFVAAPVKLGASTAGLVAVETGLRDGDVLALRDPGQSLDEILSTPAPGSAVNKPR